GRYGAVCVGGASPLGLPYTLSRAPLRRRAPFAWLASLRSLAPLSLSVADRIPSTPRSPWPIPFAWLASLRSLAPLSLSVALIVFRVFRVFRGPDRIPCIPRIPRPIPFAWR